MFDFKVDTHMHFDLYQDRNTVVNYIEREKSYTIAVTNLPDIYKRYIDKYNENNYFRVALGFHPELCVQYKNQISLFNELCDTTRYIGEIGLDYSNVNDEEKHIQKVIFSSILKKCSDKNKILSIHSRKAESEVLGLLKIFEGKVIMHWYSGSLSNLDIAIKNGYYFSINQQMIKSKAGQNIISRIPKNRILLESDAPFTKGLKDEYSINFMSDIYLYLSSLYEKEVDFVIKQIKSNFLELLS